MRTSHIAVSRIFAIGFFLLLCPMGASSQSTYNCKYLSSFLQGVEAYKIKARERVPPINPLTDRDWFDDPLFHLVDTVYLIDSLRFFSADSREIKAGNVVFKIVISDSSRSTNRLTKIYLRSVSVSNGIFQVAFRHERSNWDVYMKFLVVAYRDPEFVGLYRAANIIE